MTGDSTLAAVAREVTGADATARVLRRASVLVTAALGARGALIHRVEDDGTLVLAAAHPTPDDGLPTLTLPAGSGVVGRVAVDGVPVALTEDRPRNALHRQWLGIEAGVAVSRLCVPGRAADGGCRTVLAVHDRAGRTFGAEAVALATGVAALVAVRLELDRVCALLTRHEQDWQGLVARAVGAQETERRRIAGDLHDGVTQTISSLAFRLSAADLALSDGDFTDGERQVRAARELADLALAETRGAIAGLHSPVVDDLGLAAGLASLGRGVQEPEVEVAVEADDLDLPEHVANALYRVAQEALRNAVRHGEPQRVLLRLAEVAGGVRLRVTDDGHGFAVPARLAAVPLDGHYGLAGMDERVRLLGGTLEIRSAPGAGCTVEARVPTRLTRPGGAPSTGGSSGSG